MTPFRQAFPLALVLIAATSGVAFADDDKCGSPMADWQPRDSATAHVQSLGISPDRLKIDDGCYEIRGRDADGNRVELKLDPATLALVELEVKFQSGSDPSRYLQGARRMQAAPLKEPANNPLFTPGTTPRVVGN